MNLKEAYQYQNYIGCLFDQVISYLAVDAYVTSTERTHFRSRACETAADETLVDNMERPFGNVSVDMLCAFGCCLIDERETLGAAISNSKHLASVGIFGEDSVDLDANLSANKSRHALINAFSHMVSLKPEVVRKHTGKDYNFNAEGNQVTYFYPIEDKVTIDFDRDKLRAALKLMKEHSMKISYDAERVMLNTSVLFTPKFDVTDSFADALDAFVASNTTAPA